MPYRASYDSGTFGTGVFGVTGAIDGSIAISCAASVSASANRIVNASAALSCSCSVSSGADIVSDALIQISVASGMIATAEKFSDAAGYRSGYGLRTYGTSIYGQNESIETGSASISVVCTTHPLRSGCFVF